MWAWEDSALLHSLTSVIHPAALTVCQVQQDIYRQECLLGTRTDADEDGRLDGGIWPLTIFSNDGITRVVGGTGRNASICQCMGESSVRVCETHLDF